MKENKDIQIIFNLLQCLYWKKINMFKTHCSPISYQKHLEIFIVVLSSYSA